MTCQMTSLSVHANLGGSKSAPPCQSVEVSPLSVPAEKPEQ